MSIYAGGYFTVGVKSDGTLVTTGKNDEGQAEIDSWKDLVELDMGTRHTVGLLAAGTVVSAGENGYGQCEVSEWRDVRAIAAGNIDTMGVTSDGSFLHTHRYSAHDDWDGIMLPE